MRQIWNVTQYEVAGEGECFFQIILYDLDCIKCTKDLKSDILTKKPFKIMPHIQLWQTVVKDIHKLCIKSVQS